MNKLSDSSKKSMLSRIITGVVLCIVGIPPIISNDTENTAR